MLRFTLLVSLLGGCITDDSKSSQTSTDTQRSAVVKKCEQIGAIADQLGCGNSEDCNMLVDWDVTTGCLAETSTYYDCILRDTDICRPAYSCQQETDAAIQCELTWCKTHSDPRCPAPPHP